MLDAIFKKFDVEPMDGADVMENEGRLIPTTMSLDIALNGGVREGTVIQMAANSGTGKTTLSLEIAKQAQHLYKKQIVYIDAEGRLSSKLLQFTKGLVTTDAESKKTGIPKFLYIASTKENFLTSEKIMTLIRDLAKEGCFIILDSIAALISGANYTSDIGSNEGGMVKVQKESYELLRVLAQLMRPTKANLIVITHMQSNPSGYGAALRVYGGKGLEFFSSHRLVAFQSEEYPKEGDFKTGRMTTFQVLKTDGPPRKGFIFIRYGHGIDHERGLAEMCKTYGILGQKGAWYVFNNKIVDEVKIQGIDKVCEHLRTNREDFDYLTKTIKEMLLDNEICNTNPTEVPEPEKS